MLVVSVLPHLPAHLPADTPPNIVLILTDDQGFGDVSLHGNPWLRTPHMDRIATEGARCDRFFVSPVCAPTRAALLTGRYPVRTGVHGVTRGRENMRSEEVTLAEVFREAGYATGCFGKWHNGAHWPHHPNAQGFDEFFGFCGGHLIDYYDPVLEENGEERRTRGFVADVLTDRAIGFIEESSRGGKPFLCYVPYNTPHTPASAPLDEWRRWSGRTEVEDVYTRIMYALCENLDHNIGRLLEALEANGLEKDTIVLFLTDNGPNGERFNDGMLGIKGSPMEGGVRVPLFVRWPGKIAPGTVIGPNLAHIDLLPTLCALTGVTPPRSQERPLDGVDASALFLGGEPGDFPDRLLFTCYKPSRWSVRSGRFRATAKTLHDLRQDPGQKTNLASSLPEEHRGLIEAFQAWKAESYPSALTPLPVHLGHEASPRVTIRAHEFEIFPGENRGIAYCENRGYAHQWIDRWTDPGAYAECPVSVLRPGSYRVAIRYACDPASAGSVFLLGTDASDEIEIVIEEPWVSAVRPASEQYSKRSGGYLSREWHEIDAGRIRLGAGEQKLRLRVSRKTGPAMPEVKAVILEFQDAE